MLIGWLHHTNFHGWTHDPNRRRSLSLHQQEVPSVLTHAELEDPVQHWLLFAAQSNLDLSLSSRARGERWNQGKDNALEHLGVEERINRLFEIIICFSGCLQTCPLPTWSSVLLTVCYLLPTLSSVCLSYYSDMIKPKGKSISFKPSS